MEHDVQIDLKNSSIDSVLATLRTQGITSLEDLVERTVAFVDDVLSSRGDEAERSGVALSARPPATVTSMSSSRLTQRHRHSQSLVVSAASGHPGTCMARYSPASVRRRR